MDVLLLAGDGTGPAPLWIDPAEPLDVATDEQILRDLGVDRPVDEAGDAALLAAAVVSDAEAVAVGRDEQPLADGVGAILRYRE
jgi:hypothetical protein